MARHPAPHVMERDAERSANRAESLRQWVVFAFQATTPFVVAILMLVWQALLGGAH